MNSVMVSYDIPESVKCANPSGKFRRWGIRVNASVWIFPPGRVPSEDIADLRSKGAVVHSVEFAEQAQEKILELAKRELRRHSRAVMKHVEQRCAKLKADMVPAEMYDLGTKVEIYHKWRGLLSQARRELLAAEQCALGFAVSRDVAEAFDGLKNVLSAEFALATEWRQRQKSKPLMEVLA